MTITNRSRRVKGQNSEPERGLISAADRRRPSVRGGLGALTVVVVAGLLVCGLGPILWLAKASLSSTQDLLTRPFAWFPSGLHWDNWVLAWSQAQIGHALLNSVFAAVGAVVATVFVTVTLAYTLAILRPKWGPLVTGAVFATIFVPGVISLVPLYLTVLKLPIFGVSLLNSFWAIWLPSAASAFYVVVVKRFMESIPEELVEAARLDGAGPFRLLTMLIIPLSRPIIGVVAVFAMMSSWKDFLWPKLVLQSPDLQPVSVAIPRLQSSTALSIEMAGMFLALLIPLVVFLCFQRQILRGVSLSGGTKG
jgi:multiple sugar transport system permease protein